MPFTEAQFIDLFAQYNTGVRPAPIVLNALAVSVLVLLIRDPMRCRTYTVQEPLTG